MPSEHEIPMLVRRFTGIDRDGAYYLLTLRLVPIPFFVVNAVMGLTPIRVGSFWWASQLGMLPATFVIRPGGDAVALAFGAREWNSTEMRAVLEPLLPN